MSLVPIGVSVSCFGDHSVSSASGVLGVCVSVSCYGDHSICSASVDHSQKHCIYDTNDTRDIL